MKIIYGITKSNFGGAQRYVFDLAQAAKTQRHEVKVLCAKGGVLVDKLRQEKIEFIEIDSLSRNVSLTNDIKSFFEIYKVLGRERPEVFHTNSSKIGGIGNLAARLAGTKKIIFTGHGWAFNESWRPWWQRRIIEFLHWFTILLSHNTICVSEKTRQDILSWPFIKHKLVVIKNGIKEFDLKPRESARQSLMPKIKPQTILVGANSELHRIKGLDILLLSWQKFIRERNARLILISAGEEKEGLQNLATDLGIGDSVTFAGYIDGARAYLSALDIFVMPSRSENLPYAILEAGIAELPVIATRVGGIPEIIEAGISGALIEPENSEALFSTLVLLSSDKELRERLGRTLKARVGKDFSIEKMIQETFAVYLR